MSTTPPDEPSTQPPGSQRHSFGRQEDRPSALMPTPGNAEFLVYLLATLLVALVALISDEVTDGFWLDFFKWATAAYLISRGIAKASRVFEY
ncbi:MAG: hypothetical protein ACRDN6_15000 [Gaiellaceae bacterium]